ncbi:hypothetical protein GQ53DRAFT_26268 [Thozetella sp. PMI_491]|nr:hypothetical protein GQ53DRAFT_26268 [Thozetella sp. PMI_491]
MAERIFFIGLGNMGRGMVRNLVQKGNLSQPVLLYNRSKQRAIDLSVKLGSDKTEVVDTIADGVSKADVIFTCLSNDQVVEETLAEILKQDVQGKLIIDSSTIHPDSSQKNGEAAAAAGADFVAAPVFGAPAMADMGQLVGVLAGPAASVARAKPYFKGVTSRAEIDMSGQPYSKSSLLKIIGNTFILNMVEQLAEGHVLAEKTGLGNDYLDSWIKEMFPAPYAAYSQRMLSGDYYKRDYPAFAVDLARKDAGHALSLAKAAGTRLGNVEVGDKHLADVKAHAGEMGDLAGIYGAVRLEAGLKYENQE